MTQQFCIIGHRGAPAIAPENTLPSFARAVAEKVSGIEFDVHWIDGQLVVIHDETVDRTSNSSGALHNFSFNALRQLDFGNGTTIPILEEVIEATSTSVFINVELKGQDTGKAVGQVLPNYPQHQFMVSSFSRNELVEFTAEYGTTEKVEIALLTVRLTNQVMEYAYELGAKILNVSSKFLQKRKVIHAIQSGFRIYVYTVNDVKRAQKLRNLGVAGIFTDNPAKVQLPF